MNVADSTSMDVNANGDGINSLCTGLIPDALPEVQDPVSVENSQTGVSTKNVLSKANQKDLKKRQKDAPRWYALLFTIVNCPHLRFYCCHFHEWTRVVKKPLIVPERQIESLRIVCASEADDLVVVPAEVCKFRSGQTVYIIGGVFKGVPAKVARYQGQQRVAVIIDGLLTVATAYVPSAFLKKTE